MCPWLERARRQRKSRSLRLLQRNIRFMDARNCAILTSRNLKIICIWRPGGTINGRNFFFFLRSYCCDEKRRATAAATMVVRLDVYIVCEIIETWPMTPSFLFRPQTRILPRGSLFLNAVFFFCSATIAWRTKIRESYRTIGRFFATDERRYMLVCSRYVGRSRKPRHDDRRSIAD